MWRRLGWKMSVCRFWSEGGGGGGDGTNGVGDEYGRVGI